MRSHAVVGRRLPSDQIVQPSRMTKAMCTEIASSAAAAIAIIKVAMMDSLPALTSDRFRPGRTVRAAFRKSVHGSTE